MRDDWKRERLETRGRIGKERIVSTWDKGEGEVKGRGWER